MCFPPYLIFRIQFFNKSQWKEREKLLRNQWLNVWILLVKYCCHWGYLEAPYELTFALMNFRSILIVFNGNAGFPICWANMMGICMNLSLSSFGCSKYRLKTKKISPSIQILRNLLILLHSKYSPQKVGKIAQTSFICSKIYFAPFEVSF